MTEEKKDAQAKGKVHFYYGKSGCLQETGTIVQRYLKSREMETQKLESDDRVIVQGRKAGKVKMVLGLQSAATVEIKIDGNDLQVTIGGAKWMDKAAGSAVGLLLVWPALLTTGWGVYKQGRLFTEIEHEIATFLESK